MTPYTYVFIREDLTEAQRIIQASHASLEAGFKFDAPGTTTHLVLIGVKNEEELISVSKYLMFKNVDFEVFFEPDNDTGYTSIATKPLFGNERLPLRHFNLYGCEGS